MGEFDLISIGEGTLVDRVPVRDIERQRKTEREGESQKKTENGRETERERDGGRGKPCPAPRPHNQHALLRTPHADSQPLHQQLPSPSRPAWRPQRHPFQPNLPVPVHADHAAAAAAVTASTGAAAGGVGRVASVRRAKRGRADYEAVDELRDAAGVADCKTGRGRWGV